MLILDSVYDLSPRGPLREVEDLAELILGLGGFCEHPAGLGATAGEASETPSRFMKLEDAAAELSVTQAQVYALVRNGSLAAIKIGGRGQWRVERSRLEDFITNAYEDTARFVADHPFGGELEDSSPEDDVEAGKISSTEVD